MNAEERKKKEDYFKAKDEIDKAFRAFQQMQKIDEIIESLEHE